MIASRRCAGCGLSIYVTFMVGNWCVDCHAKLHPARHALRLALLGAAASMRERADDLEGEATHLLREMQQRP